MKRKEPPYVRVGDAVESTAGRRGKVVAVPKPSPSSRAYGEGWAQRHFYVTVAWENGHTGKVNPAHALTRASWRARGSTA